MYEEARAGTYLVITAYWIPISTVTYFKCLGRHILTAGDYWTAVVNNLWRERQKWARLTKVLIREGGYAWTLGKICLAVVQLIMLYG